jgi:protein phosphatase
VRPLAVSSSGRSAQQEADALLDLAEVSGKRTITTGLYGHVRIEPENATAALEVMSRFAVDPRWLIYLPPTMSPSETSAREGLLEHPEEALAYFDRAGVGTVIAEEKHMGSRAVLVLARDRDAALRRFGVPDGRIGRIYTRTGRPFFNDDALEQAVLERIAAAAARSGLWEELASDWLCLDAELMPWSAKAQGLIAEQYRPVAVAAGAATEAASAVVRQALARGVDAAALLERVETRHANAAAYARAFEHYVWPVASLADLKLAPFHLLASESKVHIDQGHDWHMAKLAALSAADPDLIVATPYRIVDLADPQARAGVVAWWEEMTRKGGEGMVLKPLSFVARGEKGGIAQPALKCRGREYLRIIYGPDYTMPEHLARLRERGLSGKRALALKEFALGLEALQRFIRREPLRRVHECVFGVLALESQPIDPRL